MKKLGYSLLCSAMVLGITACGSSDTSSKDDSADEKEVEESKEETTTYEAILADYSKQIQDKTPVLVQEYNNEYPALNGDINEMAKLSNDKI